jgi:hypothetical protein
MAYTSKNFKTKKDLKAAIAAGQKITVFQPALGSVPRDGNVFLEGPHFPEPHKWYASGVMKDGYLVKVL